MGRKLVRRDPLPPNFERGVALPAASIILPCYRPCSMQYSSTREPSFLSMCHLFHLGETVHRAWRCDTVAGREYFPQLVAADSLVPLSFAAARYGVNASRRILLMRGCARQPLLSIALHSILAGMVSCLGTPGMRRDCGLLVKVIGVDFLLCMR